MEFQIRQGASEPILKLRMIQDGKNDKSSFNDMLETALITFEMIDSVTGEYEILGESCDLVLRTKLLEEFKLDKDPNIRGNDVLHINDYFYQTIEYAQMILNKNTYQKGI